MPAGKDVPSYIVPQTSVEGANRGRPREERLVPAGIMMMTMNTAVQGQYMLIEGSLNKRYSGGNSV
jgi:hypothetical protein